MIDEAVLKSEEKAVLALRGLYKKYGYQPYKVSKFEEYELYLRNKDFLVSDRIITFNDTGGQLLALKPDVTLSIIKTGEDIRGVKQKVCYNENVYRVSESTNHFKEIMQAGLECIGDIDIYDVSETIVLAAKSLSLLSDSFLLDVSHLGILSAILEEISSDEGFLKDAASYIAAKNAHDLRALCENEGVTGEKTEKLLSLIKIYGKRSEVIKKLESVCSSDKAKTALYELKELSALLDESEFSDKIFFDFSVVNDMNYYSGIVFKGFIDGICEGILSGGSYDKLMKKLGRKSGAVGFAIYLDLLEGLSKMKERSVDYIVLYDDKTDKKEVLKAVGDAASCGKSASAQKALPSDLKYGETIDLRKEAPEC